MAILIGPTSKTKIDEFRHYEQPIDPAEVETANLLENHFKSVYLEFFPVTRHS